jgi:4-aminobutyrate aminotransferase-like enzyme
MTDFSTSFEQLKGRVREACSEQEEWPARIAAGIREAVDFCVSNPAAAQALVIDTRTAAGEGDYLEMVDGFAEFIDAEAGSGRRSTGPADEALVAAIAAIVAHHIRTERLDHLEEAVPELVCLALLPYLGFEQAKGWADISARA